MVINYATIAGRLTKDAKMKKAANGKEFVVFTVAVSESGAKKTHTDFFPVFVWNDERSLAASLQKGDLILVNGKLSTQAKQADLNGTPFNYTVTSITCDRIGVICKYDPKIRDCREPEVLDTPVDGEYFAVDQYAQA